MGAKTPTILVIFKQRLISPWCGIQEDKYSYSLVTTISVSTPGASKQGIFGCDIIPSVSIFVTEAYGFINKK
jgi:hypothetical protein